jgi:hypothetical protein
MTDEEEEEQSDDNNNMMFDLMDNPEDMKRKLILERMKNR